MSKSNADMRDPGPNLNPDDLRGRVLGGYRIERLLGEREGRRTFLARDERLERRVVLREFTLSGSLEPAELLRVAQHIAGESHLRASRHGGARLLEAFPTDVPRRIYCAFEYLEGANLSVLLEQHGPFDLAEAVICVLQACDAAAAASGHGAISTSSLFVVAEKRGERSIRLLDFELGRLGITASEVVFTAPDARDGLSLTREQADVWSLGVVLYQLVTGELPLLAKPGGDREAGERAIALVSSGLHVSPGAIRVFERIIIRCLAVRASDRFEHLGLLAEELLRLVPSDAAVDLLQMPVFERSRLEQSRGLAGDRGAPSPAAPMPAPGALLDDVQFSVYRPRSIRPEVSYRLLAFAHRSERPPHAAADDPDPFEEMQRQAEQVLGQALGDYQETSTGQTHRLVSKSELTFVPHAEGVDFTPLRQTIRWQASVQRVDFRMRAHAGGDRVRLGRVSVYLGALVIADVPLRLVVSSAAPSSGETERSSASVYRKIFASYCRRDQHIVFQMELLARALGDRYLRDLTDLRAGEEWSERLADLIREAEIFQLFWSEDAMISPFVRGEWECALALGRPEGFIRPVYWQSPRPEAPGLPPPALDRLHFQFIGAEAPARRARPRGDDSSSAPFTDEYRGTLSPDLLSAPHSPPRGSDSRSAASGGFAAAPMKRHYAILAIVALVAAGVAVVLWLVRR